jgi:hypothetical protein
LHPFARKLSVVVPLLAALAACTFDASTLSEKDSCQRNSDCVDGTCVDGACLPGPLRGDSGADVAADVGGTADSAPPTDTVDNPDTTPPVDTGECGGAPQNACGGCGALSGVPGDDCGTCGRLSCTADRTRVVCNEAPLNACGGCGELAADPGDACGECGDGTWACSAGALICDGGQRGLCDSCDAPVGAVEGGVCACTGATQDDPAVWSCEVTGPLCEDGAALPDGIGSLPAVSDATTTATRVSDYLQTDGDLDIFAIRVTDTATTDRLEPSLVMTSARAGQWACLLWEYDDGRDWDPVCNGGGFAVTLDGTLGCCADDETAMTQQFQMLGEVGFTDEAIDTQPGEGNDNGYAYLLVSDEGGASACTPYSVELRF